MAHRRQASGISTCELAAKHSRLCYGETTATHKLYDEDGNEA
jgi:hypothetical protein